MSHPPHKPWCDEAHAHHWPDCCAEDCWCKAVRDQVQNILNHFTPEVVNELWKQAIRYGGQQHDDEHLLNDWIVLINRYASNGSTSPVCKHDVEMTPDEIEKFRKAMIQTVALAVSALASSYRRFGRAE